MNDEQFKNVSIITPRNAQRDAWNSFGVKRFAQETEQPLHRFHCLDSCTLTTKTDSVAKNRSNQKKRVRSSRTSTMLTLQDQMQLWDLPPCLTDQVPGYLDLCAGMPVLLKFNEATELCATNGAEGTVVGWDARENLHGTNSLSTLFVHLKDPPRPVKLPNLPENVVPLCQIGRAHV